MKILSVDTSAKSCSVALSQGEQLLAQNFLLSELTHSKRLYMMIENLLNQSETRLQDLDFLAVAVGPGSFTGLRIGIATIKGLSMAGDIPCIPCSTLGSMAWQLSHMEGCTIVPVMDARRNQVYSSHFSIEHAVPLRCCPDRAISIEDLGKELEHIPGKKILIGDGAQLCYEQLQDVSLAAPHLLHQQACGVAREAWVNREFAIVGEELLPQYHRLSQAERERLEKQG